MKQEVFLLEYFSYDMEHRILSSSFYQIYHQRQWVGIRLKQFVGEQRVSVFGFSKFPVTLMTYLKDAHFSF